MTFLGINQVDDEPIYIVVFRDTVTLEEGQAAADAITALLDREAVGKHVYLIVDAVNTNSKLVDTINMVRYIAHRKPDPRATVICYGAQPMVRFFLNAISKAQFGGLNIPVFKTMEDALEAARIMSKQQSPQQA